MRRITYISTFIALLLCIGRASAQEQLSKKQLADRMFERGEYAKAANMYLTLTGKDEPDLRVVERLADCYRLVNNSREAEQWYATALTYDKAAAMDQYYYAQMLQRNNKIKDAKTQYLAYFSRVDDQDRARLHLAACDSALKWLALPRQGYKVEAAKPLNSVYSDWGTTFYGNDLIFTSDRTTGEETDKETYGRTGNAYLRLYQLRKDSVSVLQLAAHGLVNSGRYHVGPAVFSAGGDTAWITISTDAPKRRLPVDKHVGATSQRLYTRRLQLMSAVKTNGSWGDLKAFAYNNVKQYSVGQAALSADGGVLYFTSDMPGGKGGTDIWYCLKQPDGTWGKPANCGSNINTAYNEGFPTIGPGDVLYFSSDGHYGMGGMDIYSTAGSKDAWTTPEDLRYPLNSTADDLCFLTRDGLTGYLSSDREWGAGLDDIYTFTYKPTQTPKQTTVAATEPAVPSHIPGELQAVIYYDLDKYDIRPDAASSLDTLAAWLKANPQVKIRLTSYTDARASNGYNINLSRYRAQAALDHLVRNGIAPQRVRVAWLGEENLVNKCPDGVPCPEKAQQLNRRTEIYIDK